MIPFSSSCADVCAPLLLMIQPAPRAARLPPLVIHSRDTRQKTASDAPTRLCSFAHFTLVSILTTPYPQLSSTPTVIFLHRFYSRHQPITPTYRHSHSQHQCPPPRPLPPARGVSRPRRTSLPSRYLSWPSVIASRTQGLVCR